MKNQIKKSLSLFMAVLMVLSCWVWLAPTEAEAKTNDDASAVTPSENYTVKLGFALDNDSEQSDSYVEYKIWYIPNNGTGSPTTGVNYIPVKDYELSNGNAEGLAMHYETTTVGGFPYYIECATYRSNTGTSGQHKIVWNYIEVTNGNGVSSGDIFTDQFTIEQRSANNWSVDKAWLLEGYTAPESADDTHTQSGVKLPAIIGFDKSVCTDVSMTINEIGGDDVSKDATVTYDNYFDQYGVKWTASTKKFDDSYTAGDIHISKTETGDALSGEVADDIYYEDGKVYATANLQVSAPSPTDGKYTCFVVQKVTGKTALGGEITSYVSGEVTVNYPKYTVSIDGEGSITGLNYELELADGTKTSQEWKKEGYYSTSLGTIPNGKGSAAGYTFKGLWTEEQPTTGNASYNALEADFATPISSEKFAEYQADGGTADGRFITYNDVLYYNAGTEWSTSNKTISANANYYGWWLSKDITVKFYDIDGKYLGTKYVKYGQDESDIAWPTPTESYESGAYKYNNFNGTWVDINGDTVSQSDCTFTKDLILTPKYDVSFTNQYAVKFINEADGTNLTGSADYAYRTDLANPNVIPADRTVPTGIKNDLQYSYTFEGWSTQTPSSGYYHILLEDGDFNEAGTAITYKTAESDWIVRSAVTYYPVYRRHLRTYAVNFWFKDSTGTEISRKVNIKYGETLSAPTDYVPYTYAAEGYGYDFKNWVYNNASGEEATFGYNNSLVFTKENISFGLGAVEDGTENVKPVGIRAAYGDPEPTPYNVIFNYKNDKGEDQTTTAEVNHGTLITQDIVDALAPATEYDDGEAMVHFTGDWKLVEGAGKIDGAAVAEGSELSTDELLTFSPTSHVTFEAVYGNPVPFYTVTYIDGANTFSERVLQNSELPAWTYKAINDNGTPDDDSDDFEEDIVYLPKKEATAQGSYEFLGWYDEQQTDTTYAVTNGNKYEATSKVTDNLTLYPQFKFSPYTYEIKFMSYDGKVQLAAGKYEYGQNIEMLIAEANRAAQTREQDNTYSYTFLGWDKAVPTFCEGKDMTFIAQYKPVYKYYNVKWYNSVLDGENWVADKSTETEDGKTVETGLLATTKHTYNSKLNSPSVKAICTVTPPDGQKYAFAGWYYNDAEGNAHPYVRGMAVTGEMEFYATYKLTDKLFTVTTDVKGETEEYEVAANDKAVIADPNAGYVDATKHDEFKGWVTKDENGTETAFDIANTAITADITIYAKFEESEHDYDNEELVTAPTYYAKGEKKTWCSCDPVKTETTAEIEMLTDTVKPTGTIYLGTQGSWSSTGTPAYETDNQPVSLYANALTDLIITVNDTGDVDALYNPSGIGKGVANIKAFVFPGETALTAENYGAATQIAVTLFEDDTEELNNTANYVIKLGEVFVADLDENGNPQYENGQVKYKSLEDGETYIVYYYVTDKAGNRLDRLVRTAKFIYDDTDPAFTVEGDSNEGPATRTPTYCKTATVTGVEVGATLTVNGVAVALTTTSAAGTGSYTITEAGNYLVTVTDKAGNKTSKKFKVAADHSYDVKEVLSTCFADGYKTEKCIVCGDEKDKVVYPTTGHDWTISHVPATCTENGYTYKYCPVCGTEEKIYEVDGELIDPAHDHIYDMVDGEIVYTLVTAATCKTKGKEIATCKACGETITREIAIDEDAHNWGATKTLKATCTEDGKTYHTCKLCYTTEDLTTIPATGHVETQWVETKAATCGEAGVETLQCKKCKTLIGAYVIGWVNFKDDIVLTDKYEVVLDEDGNEIFEIDSLGQKFYQCYTLDENGERIFEYETREIPATGRHILAVSEDPTKTYEATADKEGQITRYCTQCGQEWTEKVDKIKKYTVKFVDEDGTTEIKTIADVVSGTTIEKTAVTEPTKANSADGKYKYTFAGWKDEKGNSVTLPFDVSANITLKASYAQSTIIYTHQFLVPNTWVAPLDAEDGYDTFATMMGAMGDSRVPVAEPVFKLADAEEDAELKKLYTFKFLGWSTTGAKGDIVTDFTIAIAEGETDANKTFYAVFEAEAIKYQVIYYNGTELVWNTTVDGGETVTFEGTEPTKAPDAENHYAFDKWYTDATLKTEFKADTAITALTRLYAGFTATAHSYDKSEGKGEVTQEANCVLPELTTYTCECGHKLTEQTKAALGHDLGEYEYDEETGMNVAKCSRCDYEKSVPASVTIKFVNENGVALAIYNSVKIGSTVTYDIEKYGTPEKTATEAETYEFAGWKDADGNEYAKDFAFEAGEEDAVYTARYTSKARTFRVTYVGVNNETLQTQAGIEYNGKVPAFTGTEPTKAYDDTYHYTFTNWSVAAGSKVTSDIVIKPVFTATKHVYEETGASTEATCDKPGGLVYACDCGHTYNDGYIPAIGHKYELIKREEPVYGQNGTGTDGYEIYKCANCGDEYTKTISSEMIEIVVNVKNASGAPVQGARVDLYNKENLAVIIASVYSNAEGVAKFYVVPGNYKVEITADGMDKTSYDVTAKENEKVEPEDITMNETYVDAACKCSCHKNNFWGTIFRLFQKLIKFFTGKPSCCACPDKRI